MPGKYYGFEDTTIPQAKQVEATQQLEPRSGKANFESSDNKLERYSKDHKPFGALGDSQSKSGK